MRWKSKSAVAGLVLFVGLLFFHAVPARASHAMGADMSYECLDAATNTYKFYATFYRDCGGISAPTTIDFYFNNVCGLTASNIPAVFDTLFNGSMDLIPGMEVSPLCPADIANSECNGGSLPGVQVYVYSAIVVLPYECPEWTVGFSVNARNNDIDNLVGASGYNLYVETKVNNTGGTCNNSPLFTQLPVTYICRNEAFNFNHGAFDPDGDSLVYSLVQPLDAAGVGVPYLTPPYSVIYPVTTTTGTFAFDPLNGQMSFTPDAEQTCVVTVLVDEYRDGVWIGSTMRDIQIIVATCSNLSPTTVGVQDLEGGSAPDDNSVRTCPGDSLIFQLTFVDADPGDILSLSTNIGLVIPGATFTWTGTNPITATFAWLPTPMDTGYYVFSVALQDNACPLPSNAAFSFDITILGDLVASFANGDATICPGDVTPISVGAATSAVWSPAAGLSCTNCLDPLAGPADDQVYQVIAIRPSGCVDTHTVSIIVDDLPDIDAGPGWVINTILNERAFLSATSATAVSYVWTPPFGLSGTMVANPVAQPSSTTTYTVTVTNATGCTASDTVRVEVVNEITEVVYPNAFTPNGDGLNDIFHPIVNGTAPVLDASIFNRWGERVWYATDRETGWDGTFRGKLQEPGSYIVVIRFEAQDGSIIPRTGTTTLIR